VLDIYFRSRFGIPFGGVSSTITQCSALGKGKSSVNMVSLLRKLAQEYSASPMSGLKVTAGSGFGPSY